ncbi:ATPase [cyanobacterium TDX16]|nr:ATPase [cyanobacterium TDX16]
MKLVTQQVVIDASPAVVYEMLVDPELFVQWMAVDATLDATPGGEIRWTHANGDSCSGTYVELVPHRRVIFTYGWERPEVEIPPGSTTVRIELEPLAGGTTRLTLVHSGLEEPAADAHAGGWRHYLDRLRTAAEDGTPGPDPLADRRVPTPEELAER